MIFIKKIMVKLLIKLRMQYRINKDPFGPQPRNIGHGQIIMEEKGGKEDLLTIQRISDPGGSDEHG